MSFHKATKKTLTVFGLLFFLALLLLVYFNKQNSKQVGITNIKQISEFEEMAFNVGEYQKCKIYSRSSMNIPPNVTTLPDKSQVVCNIGGTNGPLFEVTDKRSFETAKNSIYRFWYDTDGYKALIVDQNGAGSGEGNGKVIRLNKGGYELLFCFYYTPADFHKINEPITSNKVLLAKELQSIKANQISNTSPNCSNFTFTAF